MCIGAGSKPEAKKGCDYTNKIIPVGSARFPCKKKTKELLSDSTSSSHCAPALLPSGVTSFVQGSLWG